MINKYHNQAYGTLGGVNVPLRTGDRRWAQDRVRDFWFLMDRAGNIVSDLFNNDPILLSGGVVTQGAGANLNITAGYGYAKYEVDIPDSFSATPPSVTQGDLEMVRIAWAQQTNINASSDNCSIYSVTDDGATVNYVKMRFLETDGNTRTRAKYTGSYAYEKVPEFDLIVDDNAPTDYDIELNRFTSSGGTYSFQGASSSTNILTLGNKSVEFYINGAERLRITSDGKLSTGGETAPDVDSGGLCLNQGANDGFILTCKSNDVSHPFSSPESDTYLYIGKWSATAGGVLFGGVTDSGNYRAFSFNGYSGSTSPDTTTGVLAKGIFDFNGMKNNGSGTAIALVSDENILTIGSGANTRFIFKWDGDLELDNNSNSTAFDDENDIMLAEAARYEMAGWNERIIAEHSDRLHKLGIITNGFISTKKMQALTLGSIGQLFNIIKGLSKKMNVSEEELFKLARNYAD